VSRSKGKTAKDGEARDPEQIREVTLREFREAIDRTQVDVASAVGMTQGRVSRLENGDDTLVSTLRRHIRALGGELRLLVEFPDRPSVAIVLPGVSLPRRPIGSEAEP
jgi:transcriptional regulator with XRE-family HTH domain